MAKEKKRVQSKTLAKVEARKRPPKIAPTVLEKIKPITKKNDDKYLKVKETEDRELFKQVGEQVSRGELQWSHYTLEGNIGIHFYTIKKK